MVNVVASVIKTRLSPDGVAKRGLVQALLLSSKGATSRSFENALGHVHVGRAGASVPIWVGGPGLLRNPILTVGVSGGTLRHGEAQRQ